MKIFFNKKRKHPVLKVLVVDNSSLIRNLVVDFLNDDPELKVVGYCADGDEVCDFIAHHEVDIVLMDLDMKRMHGEEATRLVCEHFPNVKVVGFASVADDKRRRQMIDAGAKGFVLKSTPLMILAETLKYVAFPDKEVVLEVVSGRNVEV